MTAMTQDPDVRLQQSRQQVKDDNALADVVGSVDKVTPTGSGDKRPASVIWLTDLAATLECQIKKDNAHSEVTPVLRQIVSQIDALAKQTLRGEQPPVPPTNDRRIGGLPAAPVVRREDAPPAVWPLWTLRLRADYDHKVNELEKKIAEMENAMLQTDKAQRQESAGQRALALYGESEEVKTLAKRLQVLLPGANDLGANGVALVAQIAIAHGLDPLPGSDHLYAWVRGNKLNVTIGYKGLLYLARKQCHFTVQSRVMSHDERALHALGEGEIGFVTEIYEFSVVIEAKKAGVPYFPVTGIGVWKPGEEVPKGRTGAWRAEIRSLRAALSKMVSTGVRLQNVLDAQFDETVDGWSASLDAPDQQSEFERMIAAGEIPADSFTVETEDAPSELPANAADEKPMVIEATAKPTEVIQPAPQPEQTPFQPTLLDAPEVKTPVAYD